MNTTTTQDAEPTALPAGRGLLPDDVELPLGAVVRAYGVRWHRLHCSDRGMLDWVGEGLTSGSRKRWTDLRPAPDFHIEWTPPPAPATVPTAADGSRADT